jgi:Arylsulfotransferase (ASST)
MLVVIGSAATLAIASRRIVAEQSAFRAPAAARCTPLTLNGSAVLPGTSLAVSPLPDSYDASPRSQISLLGVPAQALASVRVSGSRSGSHPGSLRGYSQGDGASFVPSRPFSAGETVTVSGVIKSATARSFVFHFVVASEDVLPFSKPTPPSGKDPNEKQHFRSRPDLEAPTVTVTTRSPESGPGDIFAGPYAGPGPPGPMIFDEAGNLVWFNRLPANVPAAANLQVQQLDGKPVLTWWQGYIPPQGFGEGEVVIDDSSYRQIGRVHAGNGLKADLHDFHITPQGTALLTAFNPIDCNLSTVGGPSGGAVSDSVFQELDLRTGLVRREWHSLDHVGIGQSYSLAVNTSASWPFDYFHLNSIDQNADGTTLISARNTWALYQLNTTTGQLLSQIGGRHSTVKLGPGTRTAYQHDATTLPNGMISVFDNGAVPKVHPQSRGIVLALDPAANSATLAAQYEHRGALSSDSQGNIQQLANQDMFVGWGSKPYFSEFSAAGKLLFDAHLHGSYQSYRGYRFPWTGIPLGPPAIAALPVSKGRSRVFVSWNGDTRTAGWRLLAGASAATLTPVASAARSGFETSITSPGAAPFVAVQALDPSGAVLGTSRTIRG